MDLERQFSSNKFLYKKTPRTPQSVKIREGVEILYSTFKARGGLIRTAQETKNNLIETIGISGDFQFFPKSELTGLEDNLKATKRREKAIITKIEDFYEKKEVESPGVEPQDMTEAIMEAE
jgi:hypothetical protein